MEIAKREAIGFSMGVRRIGFRVGIRGSVEGWFTPIHAGFMSLRRGLLSACASQHRFACVGDRKAGGMEGRLRLAEYPGRYVVVWWTEVVDEILPAWRCLKAGL